MAGYPTFNDVVRLAPHYLAIGTTRVILDGRDSADLPWDQVTEVSAGGSYRSSGLASCRMSAGHESGITFEWFIDFEKPEANGRGYQMFDTERLLAIAAKLPISARKKFSDLLRTEVLGNAEKLLAEQEGYMTIQRDGVAAIRALIVGVTS